MLILISTVLLDVSEELVGERSHTLTRRLSQHRIEIKGDEQEAADCHEAGHLRPAKTMNAIMLHGKRVHIVRFRYSY